MNTEQLQMIINAFGEASTGAFIVGLLYVIKGYVTFLAGMGVIVYGIKKGSVLVLSAISNDKLWSMSGLDSSYREDRVKMRSIVEAGMKSLNHC